jgi:sulfite reductase alpha subunit-like flavoprotein
VSDAALRKLAERVAAFHITDRAMLRAQRAFEAALRAGEPNAAQRAAYLAEVRTYFTGFERDAQAQLSGVDRELDLLYQRQYNLAAERGVAHKRVEAVQGVLASLAEIATP